MPRSARRTCRSQPAASPPPAGQFAADHGNLASIARPVADAGGWRARSSRTHAFRRPPGHRSSRSHGACRNHRPCPNASPLPAPALPPRHRASQPSEVRTGSVVKLSEIQQVHLGQSPVAPVAGATGKPAEVNGGELPLLDSRFAGASDWSLSGKSAAPAATDIDPVTPPSGNVLEDVVAFMPLHGRPAIFLIVFLSMLALISTFYVLVIGSLKLVRSRSRAIRVTPRR